MVGTKKINITRIQGDLTTTIEDTSAVEDPLEIIVHYLQDGKATEKVISITMRTPVADELLAAGFLFTEGIIKASKNIQSIESKKDVLGNPDPNRIVVKLNDQNHTFDFKKLERNFYTTSSCGVCGKTSIDAVKTTSSYEVDLNNPVIPKSIIHQLPELLNEHQQIFASTGGIHATVLFDKNGKFIDMQEDVGRHNAMDKLIGNAMMQNQLPLSNSIMLVSGRASFELIQKAAMAGIPILVAIGAPSSLAIELADASNMTLIGFAKHNSFNIYTHPGRIS